MPRKKPNLLQKIPRGMVREVIEHINEQNTEEKPKNKTKKSTVKTSQSASNKKSKQKSPSTKSTSNQKTSKRSRYISASVRVDVLNRDKYKWIFCGRNSQQIELEIDHIIPFSQGGSNNLDNLQTLCRFLLIVVKVHAILDRLRDHL